MGIMNHIYSVSIRLTIDCACQLYAFLGISEGYGMVWDMKFVFPNLHFRKKKEESQIFLGFNWSL